MTPEDAARTVARIDSVWPMKAPRPAAELDEWLRFLRSFDCRLADRAVDELRTQLTWRPSMADFRSAYELARSMPDESLPALPPAKGEGEAVDLRDVYGLAIGDWVFCWRCDMAISLEERDTTARYDERRGLCHAVCPPRGSAPTIPVGERLRRDEALERQNGRTWDGAWAR